MRLSKVEVSEYRSIFADEKAQPLTLDLGEGLNTLVGINNCGKSNVLRAIALALDANHPFDPRVDNPANRQFAFPVIRLSFEGEEGREKDERLLDLSGSYESMVTGGATYAAEGRIVLRVAFEPADEGHLRRELIVTPDGSVPTNPKQFDMMNAALEALRDSVRFVLISSGESIRSVLEGNFREILHSVVKEQLSEAFTGADESRTQYASGIKESLLGPLRERLVADVGRLFPEIAGVSLIPDIPTIEGTLSRVSVELEDLVETPLSAKGTGVRGGVLVSMLGYLATDSTRDMIFALEEPEAFLHPAAQEDLRDRLEEVASNHNVSLIVTTHSPHMLSKAEEGRIFGLSKDQDGRTRIAARMAGNDSHGDVVSSLYRESTLDELLKDSSQLPEGASAVLFVEGVTDETYMRLAADALGRPDLLEGFDIRPTHGAKNTVLSAVLARAAVAPSPVLVLLDNDEPGLDAWRMLTGSHFGFHKKREVVTYKVVFPDSCQNFPLEAEDLFESTLWQGLVDAYGESILAEKVKRPDDEFHYGFDQVAKEDIIYGHLNENLRPEHVSRWVDLFLKLREFAGLPVPEESTDQIIAGAPRDLDPYDVDEGLALILTKPIHLSRYQAQSFVALDSSTPLEADLDRVGFYVDGEIKEQFPRILQHYPSIRFAKETVAQLRATGAPSDKEVSDLVERSLQLEDDLAGTTQQILLLSPPDAEETFTLEHPIKNTKERSGRPLAWAIKPRPISMQVIRKEPTTTTELDTLESADALMVGSLFEEFSPRPGHTDLRQLNYKQLIELAQKVWDSPAELEKIFKTAQARTKKNPSSRARKVLDIVGPRLNEVSEEVS